MHQNQHLPPPPPHPHSQPVEKLSSMKLIPGAKKVGGGVTVLNGDLAQCQGEGYITRKKEKKKLIIDKGKPRDFFYFPLPFCKKNVLLLVTIYKSL